MRTFIEIGAADFDTMLDAKGWRGIICEPHPVFYNKLKQQCTNPHIEILEVAVSTKLGTSTMYFPTEEYLNFTEGDSRTEWTRGAGGFRIPGWTHKLDNALEEYGHDQKYTMDLEVKTTTLDELVEQHCYNHIDFLKIDTEGHDADILEAYSWRIKPTFIKCEHGKHNKPDVITQRITDILDTQGYKYWIEDWDVYAVWM